MGSTGLKLFIVPHRGHLTSTVPRMAAGSDFIKSLRHLPHLISCMTTVCRLSHTPVARAGSGCGGYHLLLSGGFKFSC